MLLAIDIGSKYIHMVEGEYKNNKLHIQKKIKVLTPIDCVEGGEIIDATRLKMTLKEILKDHGIKTKKVSLTIEAGRLIEREVTIPKVKGKEIYPVLEGQLVSMIGAQEEYVIAYTHAVALDQDGMKVQFLALPKTIISDYKKLIEELKLRPVALQMHQNAMESFVQKNLPLESDQVIIADIGNKTLDLHLLQKGERQFSQSVKINTDQCERTLLSVRRIQEENKDFFDLDLSEEQLEEDIILDTTMRPYLTQIIQQLMSMMQYQLTRDQTMPVEEIYLCGGVSQMGGIGKYLEEQIGIPVKNIDDKALYCNAIGALGGNLDFFKRYRQVERENKTLSPRTVGRIMTLGLLLMGIVMSTLAITFLKANAIYQTTQIEKFLASEDVQSQLEVVRQKDQMLSATRNYTKGILEAARDIQTMLPITNEVMEGLSSCLPAEITVKAFSYQSGEIALSCSAATKPSINQYVHALKQSKWVHDVQYGGYRQSEDGYSFNVRIILVAGGETE